MRRIGLALAVLGVFTVVGCYGGSKAPAASSSGTQKGVSGQFYYVNLFTPPIGGVITSDVGGINCGAASASVNNAVNPPQYVYAYYGTGSSQSNRCGQTQFQWSQTVVLTAAERDGNAFLGWAGDCSGTGTCTLKAGADKSVVAIFGPPGGGHGNFTSPAVHAPAYFDFLSGAGALKCNTCHGLSLAGQGIAPSCSGCHTAAGWISWQENCSFCHGAATAAAKAGYAFSAHPSWAAPPDALSQRFTGAPTPDRTGAHQAHLLGVTPSGLSVAPPFTCATCHPVPTDLSHVGGAASRAQVVLSGAGQASLPPSLGTYNQGSGTCTTYCHGNGGSPAWSATGMQCGACHGVPPPPASGHPTVSSGLTACAGCHPETMNASGALIVGGKHLDGSLQFTGGHGDYSSPSVHGPRFFDSISGPTGDSQCSSCHGATFDGGTGPSCNACHTTTAGWAGWDSNCSFCHGTKSATTQAGYSVASHPTWSAPPDAIAQRLDPAHAAVPARTGAHQAHLTGATAGGQSFAQPYSCQTCHLVPSNLSHIGGSTSRATVALAGAGQASLPASLGTYDQATGSCATYCHGSAPSPAWATAGVVCGSCHGLPPSTASGHPSVSSNLTGCSVCHAETMNGDGTLNLAGGKHINGVRDASGGHGDYTSPATHGPRFFDYQAGIGTQDCKLCHGATYDGGIGPSCNACHTTTAGWTGWQSNCSFCHGAKNASTQPGYSVAAHPTWSAPPDAIAQRLDPAHAAVPARTGAHQAHLTGLTSAGQSFAPAFACATCHAVPVDLTHIGGSTSRATVALAGAGQASLPATLGTYAPASGTCATYCHGSAPSPAWATTGVVCGSCHALPPAPASGHPNVPANLTYCSICHPDSVNADGTIKAGGKHLDGVRDSSGGHGDYTSPATHGPRFFDYQAGIGTLDCKACHGATYDGGIGPSCNACHTTTAGWTGWQSNCSFCHGAKNASTQAGYSVAAHPTWSAPPDAIAQRLDPAHAPVPARTGAHQTHLTGVTSGGLAWTGPFTCQTCHAVPGDLTHIGGSASRATVALAGAGQALLPASLGTYTQASGTCTSYCHGATLQGGTRTAIIWSDTNLACNACHFIASPPTPHPAVDGLGAAITSAAQCSQCHADTVNTDGTIKVAGGLHVNGVLDGGGHGDYTAPATHGPAFFGYLRGTGLDCKSCHGQTFGGGSGPSCNACHASNGWTANWQVNCSFCHGTRSVFTRTNLYSVTTDPTLSAPPDALSQRLTGVPDASRTGAHQAHLTGRGSSSNTFYSNPIPCATCHAIPADYAHAGGPGRAPVTLTGTGSLPDNLGTYSQANATCTTYCHAPSTPTWTGGELGCGGCHGYAPSTGSHDLHYGDEGYACTECHAGTVSAGNVVNATHLDGVNNVQFSDPSATSWVGTSCYSSCHISPNEARRWYP